MRRAPSLPLTPGERCASGVGRRGVNVTLRRGLLGVASRRLFGCLDLLQQLLQLLNDFRMLRVEVVSFPKIIIQKARRRKDYRLKKGHRQKYLRVKIEKIEA